MAKLGLLRSRADAALPDLDQRSPLRYPHDEAMARIINLGGPGQAIWLQLRNRTHKPLGTQVIVIPVSLL